MDGREFEAAINRLGFNQTSFARDLDLAPRTVQRWVKDGPPKHIAFLIGAMSGHFIPEPHASVWNATDGGMVEASIAFELSIKAWLKRAEYAGWPRDLASTGAISCLSRLLLEMRSRHPSERRKESRVTEPAK